VRIFSSIGNSLWLKNLIFSFLNIKSLFNGFKVSFFLILHLSFGWLILVLKRISEVVGILVSSSVIWHIVINQVHSFFKFFILYFRSCNVSFEIVYFFNFILKSFYLLNFLSWDFSLWLCLALSKRLLTLFNFILYFLIIWVFTLCESNNILFDSIRYINNLLFFKNSVSF
jgi:hypothetical protein